MELDHRRNGGSQSREVWSTSALPHINDRHDMLLLLCHGTLRWICQYTERGHGYRIYSVLVLLLWLLRHSLDDYELLILYGDHAVQSPRKGSGDLSGRPEPGKRVQSVRKPHCSEGYHLEVLRCLHRY